MPNPDITGLVSARICHDLVSPLGAIGNGVELLALTGGTKSPEVQLIEESVTGANARLKMLRVAFGHASAEQTISASEALGMLDGTEATGRLTFTFDTGDPLPRPEIRCAFLAAMCLKSALPLGGRIFVTESAGAWMLRGTGDRINMVPELWDCLTQNTPIPNLRPNDVHFALLPEAARSIGRAVQAQERTEGLILTF